MRGFGMQAYEIQAKKLPDSIALLTFTGYLGREGGLELLQKIDTTLDAQTIHVVLDIRTCPVISSPGVAALLDLVLRVVEDYSGVVVLVGVDAGKETFLTMTGVLSQALVAGTIEEAIALAKRG